MQLPVNGIHDVADAARAINGIVAPAIMISASALIILALHAKYSHLIDRLRLLNEERRRLVQSPQPDSAQRLKNVIDQIEIILLRARLVRNSVMSYYVAIALFVLSSIIMGIRIALGIYVPVGPSLLLFMVAMLFVFAGTVYALRDISIAYRVALIEVREVKELSS